MFDMTDIIIMTSLGIILIIGLMYILKYIIISKNQQMTTQQQIEILDHQLKHRRIQENYILQRLQRQIYGSHDYQIMVSRYFENINIQFALQEKISTLNPSP